MSKTHFFPIFDNVWKKAAERPQNVISGFKKCGLVPFNPNAVSYDKLMTPRNTVLPSSKFSASADESLGMKRMMQVIVSNLTPETVTMFETQYEEGYNIVEESHLNMLWRIYREGRNLADYKSNREVNALQGTTLSNISAGNNSEVILKTICTRCC